MTERTVQAAWPEYARTLGSHLHQARAEAGLTQEQVARAAGISTFTYQKLEKGESNPGTAANPRLQTLVALSLALGVEVSSLLPGSGSMTLDAHPTR
jgi:transcriptional regulator with XRE-family HTH domain